MPTSTRSVHDLVNYVAIFCGLCAAIAGGALLIP
jgi:hypothetical protein